jgi:hypothetical protein
MTAELLSGVFAILLSLVLAYIPGLNGWYAGLESSWKRVILGVGLIVVALGSVGIACAGFAADLGLPLTCDRVGFVQVAQALVLALVANQATYVYISKDKTERVKVARAAKSSQG